MSSSPINAEWAAKRKKENIMTSQPFTVEILNQCRIADLHVAAAEGRREPNTSRVSAGRFSRLLAALTSLRSGATAAAINVPRGASVSSH